jgi:hypothetical protein
MTNFGFIIQNQQYKGSQQVYMLNLLCIDGISTVSLEFVDTAHFERCDPGIDFDVNNLKVKIIIIYSGLAINLLSFL